MPRKIVDPEEARQGHTCHLDHNITLSFKFPQGKITSATEKRRARASLPQNPRSPFKVTPAYVPPKLIPRGGICECPHPNELCQNCAEEMELEEEYEEDLLSQSLYDHDESLSMILNEEEEEEEDIDLYFRDLHDEEEELNKENEEYLSKEFDINDINDQNDEKNRISSSSYSNNKNSQVSSVSNSSSTISSSLLSPHKSKVHLPLSSPIKEKDRRSALSTSSASNSNSSKYINYLSNSKTNKGSSKTEIVSPVKPTRQSMIQFSPTKGSGTTRKISVNNYSSTPSSLSPSSASISSISSRSKSPSSISTSKNSNKNNIRSSDSSNSLLSPTTPTRSKSPSTSITPTKPKSPSSIPISKNSNKNNIRSSDSSNSLLTPTTPTRSKSPSYIPVRSPHHSPSKVTPAIHTPTPTLPSKIPINFNSNLRDSTLTKEIFIGSSLIKSPNKSSYEPDLLNNNSNSSLIEIDNLRESNDFPIQELFPLKENYEIIDSFSELDSVDSSKNITYNHIPKSSQDTYSSTKSKRKSTFSQSNSPIKSKSNRNSLVNQTPVSHSLSPKRNSIIPFQNSNSRLESRKSHLGTEVSSLATSIKIPKAVLASSSTSAHFSVNSLAILGFSSSEYTELFSGIAIDLEPLTIRAFDKPNPKMLLVILHFLLVILDNEQFPNNITTCWPYLDVAERTQFRRACYTSLNSIFNSQNKYKVNENISSPLLLPSHFSPKVLQEAYGIECWDLIRILCDICLEKEFENPHDPAFVENSNNDEIKEQIYSNMIAIQSSTEKHLNDKKEITDYLNELQDRYLQCKRLEVSNDHNKFIDEIKQCNLLITKINSKKEILSSICNSTLFSQVTSLLQETSENFKNVDINILNDENIPVVKLNSRMKLKVNPNLREFQFKMSEAIDTLTQNLSILCENLHNNNS